MDETSSDRLREAESRVTCMESLLRARITERDTARAALASLRSAQVTHYCENCESVAKERDEARRMLSDERIRNKRKLKTMADMGRNHPMVRGELDNALAHARQLDACFDKAINERDEARMELAEMKARRCDGCRWYQTGIDIHICNDASHGHPSEPNYTTPDHYCKSWEAK